MAADGTLEQQMKEAVQASFEYTCSELRDMGIELAQKGEPYLAAKVMLAESNLVTYVYDEELLDQMVGELSRQAENKDIGPEEAVALALPSLTANALMHAEFDIDYFQDRFEENALADLYLGTISEASRRECGDSCIDELVQSARESSEVAEVNQLDTMRSNSPER